MPHLVVTAVGSDQPGIVARVTGVLAEWEANIEDSSMTILGGHFAIVLLVTGPADAEPLQRSLADATTDLGLIVAVRSVGGGADSAASTHVLTAYGSDRLGIVHDVSAALAELGVNITDLTTRVLQGAVYVLHLEIALPEALTERALLDRVRGAVPRLEVNLHPLDAATF